MKRFAPLYIYPVPYHRPSVEELRFRSLETLRTLCEEYGIDSASSNPLYLAIRLSKKANILFPNDVYSDDFLRYLGMSLEELHQGYLTYFRDHYIERMVRNTATLVFLEGDLPSTRSDQAVQANAQLHRTLARERKKLSWKTIPDIYQQLQSHLMKVVRLSVGEHTGLQPPSRELKKGEQYFLDFNTHDLSHLPSPLQRKAIDYHLRTVPPDYVHPGLPVIGVLDDVALDPSLQLRWTWLLVKPERWLTAGNRKGTKDGKELAQSLQAIQQRSTSETSVLTALNKAIDKARNDWKRRNKTTK